MTNATKYDVKSFETIVGFDADGYVVYSITVTCGALGTLRAHEEAARELGAVKIAAIIDGERSTWYTWDGECFVCES